MMAGGLVAPALPAMREHYANVPQASFLVTLVLTLPGLVIAVMSPFMGLVADLFGRARLLVAGLFVFVASGVSGFALDSLQYILVGRVLMGVAVACVMTAASALLIDYTEGKLRQVVIGQQTAVTGLGGLIFPLLAGVLTQYDWRTPFLAYLIPLILVPVAWRYVTDVARSAEAAPSSLSEFPLARGIVTYSLAFVSTIVLYAIPLQIPYMLAEIGALSPVASGFAIGIGSLSAAGSSLLFARVRAKFSPLALLAISFGAVTIGYLVITQSSSIAIMSIGLVLAGAGFGINLANLTSWLQASMPFGLRGRAAGGLTSVISLGQFISTFVYHAPNSEHAASSAFLIASAVCAVIVAAAALSLAARGRVSTAPSK